MNCRDATRLMSELQERKLTFTERISLRFHVMMCSGCHNFKDQMGTVRLMMRAYAKGKNEENGKKIP